MPQQIIATENGRTTIIPTGPVGPPGPQGPAGSDAPNTHSGLSGRSDASSHPASAISVEAAGFNGNLADTDTDVQAIAQKLDDLSVVPTSRTLAGLDLSADRTASALRTALGAPPELVAINAQTGTTYSLVIGDKSQLVTYNNASAIALTIPLNASVAFPIGTVILGYQVGAGRVTVGGSVTLRARNGTKSAGQYAMFCLTKIGTDEWVLTGDVTT